MSLTAKHATGQELPSGTFSGGSETNRFLQMLRSDIRPFAAPAVARVGHIEKTKFGGTARIEVKSDQLY